MTRECLLSQKTILGKAAGAVVIEDEMVSIDTLADFEKVAGLDRNVSPAEVNSQRIPTAGPGRSTRLSFADDAGWTTPPPVIRGGVAVPPTSNILGSLIGLDYKKVKLELGWEPKVKSHQLLKIMLDTDSESWKRFLDGKAILWDVPL